MTRRIKHAKTATPSPSIAYTDWNDWLVDETGTMIDLESFPGPLSINPAQADVDFTIGSVVSPYGFLFNGDRGNIGLGVDIRPSAWDGWGFVQLYSTKTPPYSYNAGGIYETALFNPDTDTASPAYGIIGECKVMNGIPAGGYPLSTLHGVTGNATNYGTNSEVQKLFGGSFEARVYGKAVAEVYGVMAQATLISYQDTVVGKMRGVYADAYTSDPMGGRTLTINDAASMELRSFCKTNAAGSVSHIDTLYGLFNSVYCQQAVGGTSTVDNAYNIYMYHDRPGGGIPEYGLVGNYYGLYSASLATMNATNKWAVYVVDGMTYLGGWVGIGASIPTSKLTVVSEAAMENITLGSEFLDDTNWTSSGWTGSWSTGWTHTPGNFSTLSQSYSAVPGTTYLLSVIVTGRTTGYALVYFGSIYGMFLGSNSTYTRAMDAETAANFTCTPYTDTFDGTISISIKPITDYSDPFIEFKSSDLTSRIELRSPPHTGCQYMGINSGRYSYLATGNTAFGHSALASVIAGTDNTAVGYLAGSKIQAYGLTAIGSHALEKSISGSNVAVGSYAMPVNTTGSTNVAVGNGSLYLSISGSGNTALGHQTLQRNVTGSYNIAIGYQAHWGNLSGWDNTVVGDNALGNTRYPSYNVAIGKYALHQTQSTGTAISSFADYGGTVPGTVKANCAAAHGLPGGTTDNIKIAGTLNYNSIYTVTYIDATSFYFTDTWVATETGYWNKELEGNRNTAIGGHAGHSVTLAESNIFVGYGAGYGGSQLAAVTGSIVIGINAFSTKNYQMVLGNTDIVETLLRGQVAMGAASPATSAALDLQSTNGALLITRLTTTEKNALTPTNGMVVYDTTLGKFQGYEAGAWTSLI